MTTARSAVNRAEMRGATAVRSSLLNRRRGGFTIIEVIIVISILAVAAGTFASTVLFTGRLSQINRENAIAAEGARAILERMRNEKFAQIFALYNADPDDDPGGSGTAPGARFAIEGLAPLEGSPDGLVGTVVLPTLEVDGLEQLREDSTDEDLGLPRDLNGDSMIDDEDHAGDYIHLPIRVVLDWKGKHGQRRFELHTMLAEFNP